MLALLNDSQSHLLLAVCAASSMCGSLDAGQMATLMLHLQEQNTADRYVHAGWMADAALWPACVASALSLLCCSWAPLTVQRVVQAKESWL